MRNYNEIIELFDVKRFDVEVDDKHLPLLGNPDSFQLSSPNRVLSIKLFKSEKLIDTARVLLLDVAEHNGRLILELSTGVEEFLWTLKSPNLIKLMSVLNTYSKIDRVNNSLCEAKGYSIAEIGNLVQGLKTLHYTRKDGFYIKEYIPLEEYNLYLVDIYKILPNGTQRVDWEWEVVHECDIELLLEDSLAEMLRLDWEHLYISPKTVTLAKRTLNSILNNNTLMTRVNRICDEDKDDAIDRLYKIVSTK